MNKAALAILGSIAALVAGSLAAGASPPVPALPVPRGSAVILDTGSSNTLGYRIVVQPSGSAEYVMGDATHGGRLPNALAVRFFRDLSAAMPLSQLRANQCMKSASFGISLFVWWRGQRSPDVSCSGPPEVAALNADLSGIASALGIRTTVRHFVPMLPNEPRNLVPLQPSPSPSST